jgi:hypothetical protein
LTVAAPDALLISDLTPQTVLAGSTSFTLEVSGSGFVSGAVVRLNGSNRTTTFVSSALLRADVLAADVAGAGSISVTVRNPDSSVSNAPVLTVTAPASSASGGGGGGGCSVAGTPGAGGIADFAGAYGGLALLLAGLGLRRARGNR